MADAFKYILFSTLMSILFVIPGILSDIWLRKIGMVRDSKWVTIIVITFFFVFLKPLLFNNASWWAYGIIQILGILALNRSDFGETIKCGKWWWLPKEKKKKRSKPM